jgi:hypothetical protein
MHAPDKEVWICQVLRPMFLRLKLIEASMKRPDEMTLDELRFELRELGVT